MFLPRVSTRRSTGPREGWGYSEDGFVKGISIPSRLVKYEKRQGQTSFRVNTPQNDTWVHFRRLPSTTGTIAPLKRRASSKNRNVIDLLDMQTIVVCSSKPRTPKKHPENAQKQWCKKSIRFFFLHLRYGSIQQLIIYSPCQGSWWWQGSTFMPNHWFSSVRRCIFFSMGDMNFLFMNQKLGGGGFKVFYFHIMIQFDYIVFFRWVETTN